MPPKPNPLEALEAILAEAMASGRAAFFAMASPALQNARRLARLRDALAGGDDDQRWLAERLDDYLATAALGRTLDAALGVAPLAFCDPWPAEQAREERARLVREIVDLMPGDSPTARAKQAAATAARYASTTWPRERGLDEPPAHRDGSPEAICWRLHQCGADWPLSYRSIFDIIS